MTSFIVAAATCLAGVHSSALATIINVPADQPTIQAGIDTANTGDEVVIAPGTYSENINLNGKAITLRSTDPGNASVVYATIIRGDGRASTISCISGETSETVIDGLQIQNAPSSVQGGGLSILNNSIPTIRNCVFFGITTTSSGGAVRYATPATFSNCLFTSCRATVGGAAFSITGSAQFEDCVFRNNTATAAGGAMNGGTPSLLNCQFEGNVAEGVSAINAGGALHFSSAATITQCTFRWNRSYGSAAAAGAISAVNSNSTITNSLFCESWPVHITGSYNDQGGNVLSDAACPPDLVGACCLGGSCIPASQADCIAAGGTYQGDGTSCAAADCPAPACESDIAPPAGDDAVNVDDLLKIIKATVGACP